MLVRFDPFRELSALQNEMNRTFDSLTRTQRSPMWPAVDVYEEENGFLIEAELPGLTKDEIELHLENRILTIRGERKPPKGLEPENYHQRERFYGRFTRSFSLPGGLDATKITAGFKDGVLTVTLPKAEEVKAKVIKVTGD